MASILILSASNEGVPLGLRLAQEGHIVKLWIKEQKAKSSLEGYRNPSRVSNPKRMLEQFDLVLASMVGVGGICDELKERGKLVLGGGMFNDKLELDREYGLKVCNSLMKIKRPKSQTIDNSKDCLRVLEGTAHPLVIKPLENAPAYLTLVSMDGENRTLKSFVKERGNELFPAIVQETVDGLEVSTEGWFNGQEWVKPFNHTFEKKRLMDGDHGLNTGCMGNIVFTSESDKLIEEALIPLEPLLKKVGYVGPLDVNCIVTEKEAYFLEFSPRFGYDAIQALAELIKIPLFEFLYGVATRQKDSVEVHPGFGGAVRLSVQPYPRDEGVRELKGIQYLEVPDEAKRHAWLLDVMKNKEEKEVCAGAGGPLGCVSARGETVRECRRRIYRTIKNIVIHKDVQYREDIGEGVEEDIQKLREQGWVQ